MASSLPDRPSLDVLRRQARTLQQGVRAGSAEAVAFVRGHHPKPDVPLARPAEFARHEAQLSLARCYGFTGWPALRHYLDVARELDWDPDRVDEAGLSPADRFCALACLRYDNQDAPPRRDVARALLAERPGVVDDHPWAAAAAGDAAELTRLLRADPAAATRRGGPCRWEPLMYLCYSRVQPDPDATLAAATALLDAGADPNTGRLWCSLATPFTALTGVFGEGEQGPGRQPRHPYEAGLAPLLLDRGADPNDGQTLYNRMFVPGTAHLELLFSYGLGSGDGGPWRRRLGEAAESPAQMLDRQVGWAAEHGMTDRLELFAAQGIAVAGVALRPGLTDPNARVDGTTALHDAALLGDLDRIRELLAAGADPNARDDRHHATALGWAEYAYQPAAAELLRPLTSS